MYIIYNQVNVLALFDNYYIYIFLLYNPFCVQSTELAFYIHCILDYKYIIIIIINLLLLLIYYINCGGIAQFTRVLFELPC